MKLTTFDIAYRADLMAKPTIKRYETLREYLAGGGHRDIDAGGEIYDFACAIVADTPVIVTEEGERRWGKVLDCPILADEDNAWGLILDTEIVDEDNPDDYFVDEYDATEHFLLALAGECLETDYDKWFKLPEESEV